MKIGKWYIEIFNGRYTKYGGHWQWLARWGVSELSIGLGRPARFLHSCDYYDGYNHAVWIGWVWICWEGIPHRETEYQ